MSKSYSGLYKGTHGEMFFPNSNINFYVGPNGKAMKAKYKRWIGVSRRDRLLQKAKDPKVKNLVNQLYRPGSFIGDGGTASILEFEHATGLGLGKNGNTHAQKAKEIVKYIDKKILSMEALTNSDRKIAKTLRNKLLMALGGKKWKAK